MRAIDENTITDAAIEQMASTPNPRLREIMAALVRNLHDFAREVDLTPAEWLQGIGFLTAVGQKCTQHRQEFILLSDTLGLSTLVNALNDRRAAEAGTKSSVLGPFYREDSPDMELGQSIATQDYPNAQRVCLYGRVADARGKAIANASVEVWQPDETGNYDLQKQRCLHHLICEAPFAPTPMGPAITLQNDHPPPAIEVPMDGPVGDLILCAASPWISTRRIFISCLVWRQRLPGSGPPRSISPGDDHLRDSDTVFGVTDSLVVRVNARGGGSFIRRLPGSPKAFVFDFMLARWREASTTGRVGADPAQVTKQVAEKAY